ncbi:helix-turn-helix domain-containing protein [Sphingomonas sp. 22176]|uniref:helix-turn-helix domain-containing protein n=1 Tax=Sphingomonas sp. 22176 TaxID=3453884 RepID=UPI003F864043
MSELLAQVRRALDHDPEAAHAFLDRLEVILAASEPALDSILLPAMPPGLHGRRISKGGLASWQVRRVSEHVEARLTEPVTVDALAEVAQLSTGHFCRAFKVSVGETPHGFLIRRRVRRAQSLMLRTSDPLSQIALACGLTDQAHLTRLFRRMVGETPLSWRRNWAHILLTPSAGP